MILVLSSIRLSTVAYESQQKKGPLSPSVVLFDEHIQITVLEARSFSKLAVSSLSRALGKVAEAVAADLH